MLDVDLCWKSKVMRNKMWDNAKPISTNHGSKNKINK